MPATRYDGTLNIVATRAIYSRRFGRLIFGAGGRKLKKGKERKGERGEGEGKEEGGKEEEEETVEEEEVLLMIRLLC